MLLQKRLRLQGKNLNGNNSVVPFIFTAFLVSICFCSCTSSQKSGSTLSEAEGIRLISLLERREKDFQNFRGVGKLQFKSGPSKTMKIAWIGSRPGNLRLEMLGMWGQPLATFLLKEPTFCLYIVKDNVCYEGKSTAHNLSKLLTVSVESEDLFAVLSGHPPLPTFQKVRTRKLEGGTAQTLSLFGKWRKIIQKMWVSDTHNAVEKVESFDRFGDVKYTILFSDFKRHGRHLVPYEIQIVRPRGTEIVLNIQKFENGIAIPDKAFELDLGNAKIIGIDS